MRVLIIEDEYPAAERLTELIHKANSEISILDVVDSIETAKQWFETQSAPDLIFSDIQLSDGLSFEIFSQVPVNSPIIFTTAYDEYAIRAFKVKSIDYLLKPIKLQELKQALEKYYLFQKEFSPEELSQKINHILQQLQPGTESYKKRFLVHSKDKILPLKIEEVAYFFTANENVYLMAWQGKKYTVDFTLDQLAVQLDPDQFFRINRQYISCFQAIDTIVSHFNGRLKLVLSPPSPSEVFVSKEKAKNFKMWLAGEMS